MQEGFKEGFLENKEGKGDQHAGSQRGKDRRERKRNGNDREKGESVRRRKPERRSECERQLGCRQSREAEKRQGAQREREKEGRELSLMAGFNEERDNRVGIFCGISGVGNGVAM
jgi:hypothetical protein